MVVTGAPRKRLVGKPARGFESHPLRQISACAPIWRRGGDSGAPPLARLRARIPTPIPIALPFGGVGGIQALRRSRGFGRESRHQSSRLRSHLAEWGGIQALRRARGFGRESRHQPSDCAPIWRSGGDSGAPPLARLRARIPTPIFPIALPFGGVGGGFRRSAARAASGANPDTNLPIALPFGRVGGDSGAPPLTRLRARIPTAIFPIALPFGGVGGIQALRRSRGFGRESRHQSSRLRSHLAEWGGDSGAPPLARLRARIPTATFRLRSHLAERGGIQALRRSRGFGRESRQQPSRLRSHLAEWGGFRRSAAAHAASGANPDSNLPIALPFGGVGGIQALRRSRGFGRESRQQPSDCAPIWRSGGFRRSAAHAASGRPGACAA